MSIEFYFSAQHGENRVIAKMDKESRVYEEFYKMKSGLKGSM